MAEIAYSIWNGVISDNRAEDGACSPIKNNYINISTFSDENKIRAFVGDKGFIVLDDSVDLLTTFFKHLSKAADESCGKCTPCRVGIPLLRDSLADIRKKGAKSGDWQAIERLARHIADTSLCGLGQTSTKALLAALKHFSHDLEKCAGLEAVPGLPGLSYVTAPCMQACPSAVDVPRYIDFIKDGRPDESLGVILEKYPLASSCSRVCVRPCEAACTRSSIDQPVAIRALKRHAADRQTSAREVLFSKDMIESAKPADMRVAVVGAGPAGVSCAYHLLLAGYHVDVLEARDHAGGMAATGIPSYRLPKDILQSETGVVETLGGRFLYNKAWGKDFVIDDLFAQGYKAVFLGVGCAEGALLGVKNEDPTMKGYLSGIDFLRDVYNHVERAAPLVLGGVVAVVGGGNVAMDCVRSALRLGAKEVHLVYRRTKEDMPADAEEIKAAQDEGVIFHYLSNPSSIVSRDGRIVGVDLISMKQTEPDKRGRIGVAEIEGSDRFFACDTVIAAIGQRVDRAALSADDSLLLDVSGKIVAIPGLQTTNRAGVFSAGDCATGPDTLIGAMAGGMEAAQNIDRYLQTGKVVLSAQRRIRQILNDNSMFEGECPDMPVLATKRFHQAELEPEARVKGFDEVEGDIPQMDAYREAERCLRCYRIYSVVTENKAQG